MTIRSIHLTPETDKIARELFNKGKGNFSEWIQQKLIQKARCELNKKLIIDKLESLRLEKRTKEMEILRHERLLYQANKKEQREKKNDEESQKRRTQGFIEDTTITILKHYQIKDKTKAGKLAKEWAKGLSENNSENKNGMNAWLESKGVKKR
jgi:hypothetical protein